MVQNVSNEARRRESQDLISEKLGAASPIFGSRQFKLGHLLRARAALLVVVGFCACSTCRIF
ncbi:hypothetical protein HPP92_027607 [Vanilla planifolia]|uniref:Uncharacterized protein n=1 Tax=Vanilla planifolia TaxID=51239 RepID=A0A835PAQ6_VANPL|nr:hypothetical protein HPP92_027607 [Vanilla planifolia]